LDKSHFAMRSTSGDCNSFFLLLRQVHRLVKITHAEVKKYQKKRRNLTIRLANMMHFYERSTT